MTGGAWTGRNRSNPVMGEPPEVAIWEMSGNIDPAGSIHRLNDVLVRFFRIIIP